MIPRLLVQVGFGSAPDDPAQDWTDISAFVRLTDGVEFSRGRSDEQGIAEPKDLTLTLNNDAGHFTFGNTASDYYPNVVPGKRIRVSVYPGPVPRFDGIITGWPTVWDRVAERARCRLTAVDRLAALGRARQLRDPILEEVGIAAAPQDAWWWGSDEPFPFPGETLYPAEDLYPSLELFTGG